MSKWLSFTESLELKQISEDTFENVHEPWTWDGGNGAVPGGVLMSQCAAAAYRTVGENFTLNTLQAQFLAGSNSTIPYNYTVKHLGNGKRFAIRLVVASQKGKNVTSATLTFINSSTRNTPAMNHSVHRESPHTIDEISLDDLERKSPLGPFMRFQRLPVHHPNPSDKAPQSGIATSAAQISTPIPHPPGHASHILGLVNLSDYHVLDSPLTLSGLEFGLFAINDTKKKALSTDQKMYTSVNHTIHFHSHDGYRADDLLYVEARSPWAKDGTALVQTRIFTRDGVLVASCVQEAFYVLKESASSKL